MSLLSDITISFVFVYNIVMAFAVSTAILYSSSISFIFCQSIESKILQKSVKSRWPFWYTQLWITIFCLFFLHNLVFLSNCNLMFEFPEQVCDWGKMIREQGSKGGSVCSRNSTSNKNYKSLQNILLRQKHLTFSGIRKPSISFLFFS